MKQQQPATRDSSRPTPERRSAPCRSAVLPAVAGLVRSEPLEQRALFSGGGWMAHVGSGDFGSHDGRSSNSTADLHASSTPSTVVVDGGFTGKPSGFGSSGFRFAALDRGSSFADSTKGGTAGWADSTSKSDGDSTADSTNHFGRFGRNDWSNREDGDPSDAGDSDGTGWSSPVVTVTSFRSANWQSRPFSMNRRDSSDDWTEAAPSSDRSNAVATRSDDDGVTARADVVLTFITAPARPVGSSYLLNIPVSTAVGVTPATGHMWNWAATQLSFDRSDGVDSDGSGVGGSRNASGFGNNDGYGNNGYGNPGGNGLGSFVVQPATDVAQPTPPKASDHLSDPGTQSVAPAATSGNSEGGGQRLSAARATNKPGTVPDRPTSNVSAASAAGVVVARSAAVGVAQRSWDSADAGTADPAARPAGRGDGSATDPSGNGQAVATAKPATQIFGPAPAADSSAAGLSGRAAAIGAAARLVAGAAETQLAAAGVRAIEFLRLPLAALPLGLAGGGAVDEVTDGGGGFESAGGPLGTASLLGLAPWHIGSTPAEGKAWAWNVTAAGSLALAVGGYWYVQAASARRRELEQATAATLAGYGRGRNRRSESPFATTPLREAVASTRSMVDRVDRWCRERING